MVLHRAVRNTSDKFYCALSQLPSCYPYTVIEITPALFNKAMQLANTHALRAYDAVQLAAALEINQKEQGAGFAPVTLISADQALNDAATVEGLPVDDPNLHP
ncbi:MAG: type II toxin-antitoxin system VapC family toxin [Isosphaeraceae bacterium]